MDRMDRIDSIGPSRRLKSRATRTKPAFAGWGPLKSAQADFVPALTDCGFVPRLLLPYAGTGDLLVFQRND